MRLSRLTEPAGMRRRVSGSSLYSSRSRGGATRVRLIGPDTTRITRFVIAYLGRGPRGPENTTLVAE
jgi:hypothetical protein